MIIEDENSYVADIIDRFINNNPALETKLNEMIANGICVLVHGSLVYQTWLTQSAPDTNTDIDLMLFGSLDLLKKYINGLSEKSNFVYLSTEAREQFDAYIPAYVSSETEILRQLEKEAAKAPATILSIVYDFAKKKFYGSEHALEDIKKKTIAAPSNYFNSFSEDPLRFFRFLRLKAQFKNCKFVDINPEFLPRIKWNKHVATSLGRFIYKSIKHTYFAAFLTELIGYKIFDRLVSELNSKEIANNLKILNAFICAPTKKAYTNLEENYQVVFGIVLLAPILKDTLDIKKAIEKQKTTLFIFNAKSEALIRAYFSTRMNGESAETVKKSDDLLLLESLIKEIYHELFDFDSRVTSKPLKNTPKTNIAVTAVVKVDEELPALATEYQQPMFERPRFPGIQRPYWQPNNISQVKARKPKEDLGFNPSFPLVIPQASNYSKPKENPPQFHRHIAYTQAEKSGKYYKNRAGSPRNLSEQGHQKSTENEKIEQSDASEFLGFLLDLLLFPYLVRYHIRDKFSVLPPPLIHLLIAGFVLEVKRYMADDDIHKTPPDYTFALILMANLLTLFDAWFTKLLQMSSLMPHKPQTPPVVVAAPQVVRVDTPSTRDVQNPAPPPRISQNRNSLFSSLVKEIMRPAILDRRNNPLRKGLKNYLRVPTTIIVNWLIEPLYFRLFHEREFTKYVVLFISLHLTVTAADQTGQWLLNRNKTISPAPLPTTKEETIEDDVIEIIDNSKVSCGIM